MNASFNKLANSWEKQEQIINLQSEIIDELFQILAMHLSADELTNSGAIDKIKLAVDMRIENETEFATTTDEMKQATDSQEGTKQNGHNDINHRCTTWRGNPRLSSILDNSS